MAAASKLAGYHSRKPISCAARWQEGQENDGEGGATISSKVARARTRSPEKKANANLRFCSKNSPARIQQRPQRSYRVISYQTAVFEIALFGEFMPVVEQRDQQHRKILRCSLANVSEWGFRFCRRTSNRSSFEFTPESHDGKMAIRYGLAAIKNVAKPHGRCRSGTGAGRDYTS